MTVSSSGESAKTFSPSRVLERQRRSDIDTRWLWHITLGAIFGERYADDGAAGSLRTCGEIMMRMIQLLAGTLALLTGVLAAEVSAAELKVLSAGAMRAVLQELARLSKPPPGISSRSSTGPLAPSSRKSTRTMKSMSRS